MATVTWGAGTGLLDLGQLLKNLYAPWDIEDLQNLTHPVVSTMWAEGSANLGGAGFIFPVRAQGNFAHAYIDETGNLPTAQRTVVRQATVNPKVHAGLVEISGLAMAMSSGDAAAFARGYDEQMQELLRSMTQYKEGVGFRDGFAKLATFVTEPDGAKGAVIGELIFDDVAFVNIGMRVHAQDSVTATTNHGGPYIVADVDWVTKSISFNDTTGNPVDIDAAAAAGDFLVLAEAATRVNYVAGNEVEPIGADGALLDSGTYLGIARSTYPLWESSVYAANGLFDEDVVQKVRTRLTQATGMGLNQLSSRLKLITHPIQAETLVRLVIPRVQYSGFNDLDILNKTEVKVGGIPVLTSYLAPADTAYFGDWKYAMSLYPPGGKLHIDTQFNGTALKWVASKDVGQAFVKEYCALAVKRPNAFVRVTGLTEPATR